MQHLDWKRLAIFDGAGVRKLLTSVKIADVCKFADVCEREERMSIYLDCNATTPVDSRVADAVIRYMTEEFGNAGSRTHEYGTRAKQAVQLARDRVAVLVDAARDEIIFTSGATESNNLAILGLAEHGERTGRKHIISSQIEHKAILEPLEHLTTKGFDVTLVAPTSGGWIDPACVAKALRKDTLLVSIMHVNNETGVIQPLAEIANALSDHPSYFHTDAAQGFGKNITTLKIPRIDLISISGHKIYGPKGVGALVARRRELKKIPLKPLFFGGGQERNLRPGTLPVPLIVGIGLAADLASKEIAIRTEQNSTFKSQLLTALAPLGPRINGDPERVLPTVINLGFPGLDSEAVMLVLKNEISISNGSACTSQNYTPSHVLKAMGLSEENISGSLRLSWCHLTPNPNWNNVVMLIKNLRR